MSLETLKPDGQLAEWNPTTWHMVLQSIMLLSVHGFITEAQSQHAKDNYEKWLKLHNYDPHEKLRRTIKKG